MAGSPMRQNDRGATLGAAEPRGRGRASRGGADRGCGKGALPTGDSCSVPMCFNDGDYSTALEGFSEDAFLDVEMAEKGSQSHLKFQYVMEGLVAVEAAVKRRTSSLTEEVPTSTPQVTAAGGVEE